MSDEKKIKVVHLHHDPVVLRIEKRVRGEGGIETFQTVGEITLARGRNEVDAKAWDSWYEVDGATNPLITGGSITVEEPKEEPNGKSEEQGAVGAAAEPEPGADVGGANQDGESGGAESTDERDGGSGGSDAEQGEVRDGGLEASAEP